LSGGQPPPDRQFGLEDEGRWYRLELSLLRDAFGRPLGSVALLVNTTNEHALEQLRYDLTHMLIHDLNNPLSAMQMALEMVPTGAAAATAALDDDARAALDIIRRSNERAQRLVSSLLDVSQLETGNLPIELEPVDAAHLAAGLRRELLPWAEERGLALEVQAAPGLPPVNADPELLDRVLRNLLGNAIKFTPAGGRVTCALAPGSPEVCFTVADTGPGLPGYVAERLFQKFVRGAGPGHGHGLGLAFCKLAVEAMGGRIWVESQPGGGTAFHFKLPPAVD
jgi:signal transduction histidine kinase